MNKHLQELIELSQIDKSVDNYNLQLEVVDKKIAKVQKKITAIQEEFDDLNKESKENEEKIKAFEEQLILLKEQLESNTKKAREISTEKEMKALSLEEDIAKEKMTFANEEIERLQKINETKEALTKELEEKLAELQENFNKVNSEVSAEKIEIETTKAEYFAKRQKLSKSIEQKVLSFYEKIRVWAGNTAVVSVKKQACYGCYMKLNDKTYAEVIKAEEIVNCPHCGRILHLESVAKEK